jgi:hypothetical protein
VITSLLVYFALLFRESDVRTLAIVTDERPKLPRRLGDSGVTRKVTGGCSMRLPESFTATVSPPIVGGAAPDSSRI